MMHRLARAMKSLELEEQILNAGLVLSIVGLFLPWISGDWFGGDRVSFSGLTFYHAFLGWSVLMLCVFQLAMTVVPLAGGPAFIPKAYREGLRLVLSSQSFILTTAALSVLIRVSFEFSRMNVRYGLYLTLIGCGISLLESIIRFVSQRRQRSPEGFHHPEDLPTTPSPESHQRHTPPPAPPPPPPPPVEEHPHHA